MKKVKLIPQPSQQHQMQPDNQQPSDSPLRLRQVNGPEVTPAEKPLPPAAPVAPAPAPIPAPTSDGVPDVINNPVTAAEYMNTAKYVISHQGRLDKAQLWAQMGSTLAMMEQTRELRRLNEFLGVYDSDEDEDPEAESSRLGDVLVNTGVDLVWALLEETMPFMPEEQRKLIEAALKKSAEEDEEGEDET